MLMSRKTPYRDISLFPVKTLKYPYPLSTVFTTKSTGENGATGKISELSTLRIVDYRYSRFALDPRSGLFSAIKQVKF